jgi:hypothetical protein
VARPQRKRIRFKPANDMASVTTVIVDFRMCS